MATMLLESEAGFVMLRQAQVQRDKGRYRVAKHQVAIDRLSRILGQRVPKQPCYRTSRVRIIKGGK